MIGGGAPGRPLRRCLGRSQCRARPHPGGTPARPHRKPSWPLAPPGPLAASSRPQVSHAPAPVPGTPAPPSWPHPEIWRHVQLPSACSAAPRRPGCRGGQQQQQQESVVSVVWLRQWKSCGDSRVEAVWRPRRSGRGRDPTQCPIDPRRPSPQHLLPRRRHLPPDGGPPTARLPLEAQCSDAKVMCCDGTVAGTASASARDCWRLWLR